MILGSTVTYVDAANYCYSCTSCSDPFTYTGNASCSTGSSTCMVNHLLWIIENYFNFKYLENLYWLSKSL